MRTFVGILLAVSLSACRIVAIPGEGGTIVGDSGWSCAAGSRCVVQVTDTQFTETYRAQPQPGYQFVGWKQRDRGLCGGTREPCALSTTEFGANSALLAFLDSDERFYLHAVFEQAPLALVSDPAPNARQVPLLYVLLDFPDMAIRDTAHQHFQRIYHEPDNARHYFLENFYGQVELVPAAEFSGTPNDGIVAVSLDMPHPNTVELRDPLLAEVTERVLADLSERVELAPFDTNGDRRLSGQELAVVLVYAGGGIGSDERSDWKVIRAQASADDYSFGEFTLEAVAHVNETSWFETVGYVPSAQRAILVHELGHVIWGLADLYDEDGSSDPVQTWDAMSRSVVWETEDRVVPPHMSGFSKIAAGLSQATELVHEESALRIVPLAYGRGGSVPEGQLYQVWLDRYRLREYVLIENRQRVGFDRVLAGEGILVTRVQGLASNSDDDEHPILEVLPTAESADVLQHPGDLLIAEEAGSPGAPVGGLRNALEVRFAAYETDRTALADVIIRRYGTAGGHLGFVTNPHGLWQWGYGQSRAAAGTLYTNTSELGLLDGVEVRLLTDGSTVDVKVYESLTGVSPKVPTNLLYSERFQGDEGWNRLILDAPLAFPPGESRFVVVIVNSPGEEYPLSFDGAATETADLSRFHLSKDGNTFYDEGKVWHQYLLLSASP